MFPSAGEELAVKPAGLVIAAVSFVMTRGLTAGIAANSEAVGVTVPLAVGLGTVVYGVSLSVSTHTRAYARVVALWYLFGTLGVASIVAAGNEPLKPGTLSTVMTAAGVVSAGVGGGGLGILVGVRAGRAQRQRRHLAQQADQVTLLQRLLRHEVLNGLTAIRGHAGLLADGGGADRSLTAVESNVNRIQRTVDDVGYLVRTVDDTLAALGAVDLADVIQQCRERLPNGGDRVVVDSIPSVMVRGDDQLDTVVAELVTTALDRTDDEVALDVTPGEETIELTVTAAGDWLTDVEQTVLLEGPPEYDRPDFGYGISIVRLLVDRYGGSLAVSAPTERTAVTVELLRTMEDPPPGESSGVAPADLRDAAVAGLGAGLAMGALLQVFTGQVAVIGSLYGLRSLPVGWVVHLFHSVLFSTVAVVTIRRTRLARVVPKPRKLVAVGVSYGLVLWLVGAGFLMPAWLLAVGGTSPIPNLQPGSLMAHLGWGVWLGASLALLLPNSPLGRVSPSS
jgi:two-component system OmpR family sensor kinase